MSDDPTADFLAREKAILGDDADLFASGEIPGVSSGSGLDAFPDLDDAPAKPASPAKSASPIKSPSGMDAFPSFDEPIAVSEVRVTGNVGLGDDQELDQFESAFPDLSSDIPAAASAVPKPVFNALAPQPYGQSPYPPTAAPQPRSAASILPAPEFTNTLPETEEETEPIREWREKQAEEIKRRNAADQEKRDEMADKAEKAIDQFYEDYNKEKEKNIRENKEHEAKLLEQLKDDIARGTTWERITDLIGLENSQSKTIRPSVSGGSDLARMKEILLALRREGEKAPGATGF
ncbi:hypothetical protein CspeluHIS016_0802920 [Cutaneotrichosporon spelunceum]|uniref:Clathrin light chain n=1 Tax=Cutaneotrichosporon spelunceum TaxID=1672016 RepID=A0AAD3TZZ7_9TREE|nr:hypothetical protein CspeluHIS016_0802920 [Cutaneotrichosporon spelunceum]